MKTWLRLAIAAAVLAGCSTESQLSAFRDTETQLQEAREHAWVTCISRSACDQVWNRTRLYVQLYSRTPISRLDESVIETRTPLESGIAYFWADRRTDENGTTTIRLKGMCRGMYASDGEPAWTYAGCAAQIRRAEINFREVVGEPE
ncbi:hypothetical protein [Paraburkholderia phenazinium]|jgi:hypothetical protein|uniref:Uncharacterized protein n=1 Tax=Paraburkholderia phenazinium TaxID=60549 RepID=A0A1G7UA19_9BURK|nr:hypothetical protein [Paraburkholderia phenazinium]SDG43869.1 hypothetical protein SAMN05216466_103352 [Paraburkholderia phenazinium]